MEGISLNPSSVSAESQSSADSPLAVPDLFFPTESPADISTAIQALPTAVARFQVCGSCRRKKRKCSLDRPTCSLCRENGWPCEYRNMKRRPGPAKGTVGLKAQSLGDRAKPGAAMNLGADAKRRLVNVYFHHIQPSFPLFSRKAFEQELGEKTIPDGLLNAIFAVASRLVPESELPAVLGASYSKKPWESFARLADRQNREEEDRNSPIELNDVKTEILLTLYEYTNYPGRKAWMKVGNVVRMALGLGLHRLDADIRSPNVSDFQLEEQRAVWWAVWKLDSCINILSGTPFGIDSLSVGTALATTSVADFTAGITNDSPLQYLPPDAARPWKSAPALLMTDTQDGMGMYLLAVNHLRTVTVCRQRLFAYPTADLVNHLTVLRNSMTCMRLSLPNWYFEPARESAFESPEKHRLRLETLLIFFVGHIQAFLPFANQRVDSLTADDGPRNWKECINTAQQVAAVFHHWKPDYFKIADPMISSIVWFSHSILNIHLMSGIDPPEDASPDPKILNALDLLHVALENFASLWHISRILLESVDNLQVWSWLKIGFPGVLSLLSQLRIPLDPLKNEPGLIDPWQVAMQAPLEIEENAENSLWSGELIDWDA